MFNRGKKISMKQTKTITAILGIVLVGLLVLSSVSAYQLLCLTYGQKLPNAQNPRYSCWHDLCINICVDDFLRPTNPDFCSGFGACELFGNGSIESDDQAPNLTVKSPENGHIYSSRKVIFDLEFDEPASIYWIDNINGRGRWKRICSNCDDSLTKGVSFKDGLNNITIKAEDRNGNEMNVSRQFRVDSKKPKINRVEPRRGFASGVFDVQFTEENPKTLTLYYGRAGEYHPEPVNLSECDYVKKRNYCQVNVSLIEYNGKNIEYWFELVDIADTVVTSRPVWLDVDTQFPVLENPDDFWEQGEGKKNKYIYFNFEVDEENFDEITYIDWNDRRPRWRRLCSRLKNGVCEKKKSFRRGGHEVDIQIMDEAGNAVSTERLEFWVV